jgi:hypothetical protein
MPQQFVVPQFIDAEDKIFGPVTARQFLILMASILFDFILFKLLSFVMFLIFGTITIMLAGVVAFVKVNGVTFHYFALNVLQTFKRPKLRVWQKSHTNAELRDFMKQEPPPPSSAYVRKEFSATSRLQQLTLVVNTGGVFKPEE